MNTILVVQDEETIREFICKTLEEKGYKVIAVRNGAEAVSFLELAFDHVRLVLTDYHLPDFSGYELKKRIEAIAGYKQMPVVFLTAESHEDKMRIAHQISFIDRSVEAEALFIGINKLLQFTTEGNTTSQN
jgi:CheY-like chemotaxis protein